VTLVSFVVDKWWTYCWGKQNQIFGPARNQRLYAVESIGLEVLFVISNGTEYNARTMECTQGDCAMLGNMQDLGTAF
jgi:hypothetical protein